MENNPILNSLNDAQREAVSSEAKHLLVLAGAGSGKTRVLAHRIAYVLRTWHISPYAILAVTFTNKAAAEMRSRIEILLQNPVNGMWVGTFHGIAHRMLRAHYREAKLSEGFQVIDSDDQARIVRRILKTLELDDKRWTPQQVQSYINSQKDLGSRAKDVLAKDPYAKTMQKIYQQYEDTCERGEMVDFGELLLRVFELLRDNPEILQHYRQRFQHILVDEFQDTNTIQYAWLKLLVSDSNFLLAVGDDDQSIYGWRGAKIENIQRFSVDFANTSIVRLEQNYRSTKTILAAANAVIENNNGRLGKDLWTQGDTGELISIYAAFNEIDEANFIIDCIKQSVRNGNARSDIGILYRSNAQSRVLEEALLQCGIPYRIYGGLRFFERSEIKDTLAYLRLIANVNDDAAFERVVNLPVRGIGNKTIDDLRQFARENSLSFWQAAEQLSLQDQLSSRAKSAIAVFMDLIRALSDATKDCKLPEITQHVILHSGLQDHYRNEKGEKGLARIENLNELVAATREFIDRYEPAPALTPLTAFLTQAVLDAGDVQNGVAEDAVQLMTIHAAKGLEFPILILCGMEEGLFPHHLSVLDGNRLEEERRLCYVGMTRAMQKLYLTFAEVRRFYNNEEHRIPSRFLREIPRDLIHELRLRTTLRQTSASSSNASSVKVNNSWSSATATETNGFKLGQRVRHQVFGLGVVLNFEGKGEHAQVQVKFENNGTKRLMLSLAKLEPA